MSFDLIETVGAEGSKAGAYALKIFGIGAVTALGLVFGKRIIDLGIYAMTEGLEFLIAILALA